MSLFLNREYVLPEMKTHYDYLVEHFSINDPHYFQPPPELKTWQQPCSGSELKPLCSQMSSQKHKTKEPHRDGTAE